jgi:hypothetical protein
VTPHRLTDLERQYVRDTERAETSRQRRNLAIREAVAGGMRKAEVARLTGLGRGRIGQIVNDRKES